MIKKLENSTPKVAKEIRAIFQISYKVEAELLQTKDFPPLKRTLKQFIMTDTSFFSYSIAGRLVAILEISEQPDVVLIRSLVVNPAFFRQGIAGKLISYTFNNFKTNLFIVETGLANTPAIALYKKYGFTEVHQWETDYGIRKIKFEKKNKI
jgi:ribosomal protein S18 acetylase RimI-like enzyme